MRSLMFNFALFKNKVPRIDYICVLKHSSITVIRRRKRCYRLIYIVVRDVEDADGCGRKNPRERSCPAFKKNELIYLEDEWPKDLMCLFKGKVKIYRSGVGDAPK